MSGNARRRKEQARARRRRDRDRRERSRENRAIAEGLDVAFARLVEAIADPGLPPAEAARHILEMWEDAVPPDLVTAAVMRQGQERAEAVAAALEDRAPGSLTAAAFAAAVAEAADDWQRAEERLRAALAAAPRGSDRPPGEASAIHADLTTRLAYVVLRRGGVAEAAELALNASRADPSYGPAQHVLSEALDVMTRRRKPKSTGPCRCGSSRPYRDCCRPREAAVLKRLSDRSPMYDLRDALRPFLERPDVEPFVTDGFLDFYLGEPPHPVDQAVHEESKMAVERALVVQVVRPEDEAYTMLDWFADDPATPAPLARMASEWRQFVRYGIWEVADPAPRPCVLLEDVATGGFAFVAVSPEQLEGVPRWSALVGPVLPVEGIWRTGSAFLGVTPDEARTLALEVLAMTREALPDLVPRGLVAGFRRKLDARRRALREHSPTNELPSLTPELAHLVDRVIAAALPALRADLLELRSRPVEIRTSDGHRLELVTARVRLGNAAAAEATMKARPDEFEPTDEGWVWLGPPNPQAPVPAAAVGPARSVLAWIESGGPDELSVRAMSRERLDRYVEFLRQAGADPTVESTTRFDPVLDLPAPGEAAPVGSRDRPREVEALEAEILATWRKRWVDEPVPALGNRTPREAASDAEGRPLLEALLRDFEHREDADRAAGRPLHGIAHLRNTLGMPDR